ncbi:dipeptidyl aminopeptidase/acylaminoacyl peptidase [Mycolicibacterium rhodesiae NBB3]|uniref:Dipeptidyl aminopeptidase/acylaminoacyl peptidase n=2 Tax=Mycolicibacterium rhodesiae TaxID=36814 RepID=G8RJF6_MYCRN|nr:dipeptidyl aminopeptidase/acylaminoacyl peptidase [Mycolicibacterium rhodesiae NBB3]
MGMPEPTSFDDLDAYVALPRVSGLAVSADGTRVVTTIAELNEKRTEYVSAVWELDPAGLHAARRLTRGAKGESSPVFTAEGDVLFVARRAGDDDDKKPATLWRLPAAGGEAFEALALPGGVETVHTAKDADIAVVSAPMMPSARSIDDDRRIRDLRKDKKVSAILHADYPIRHWDKDLGPGEPHLFGTRLDGSSPQDLTESPGSALWNTDFDVSPDGRFVVASWQQPAAGAAKHVVLVRIDTDSGERTVIADHADADLWSPAIAPDGSAVAYACESYSTPDVAPRITLCCLRFGQETVDLTLHWDRWPSSVTWSHDGSALIVTADQDGRGPIFSIDPSGGAVTQLTFDDYAYTDVCAAPAGVLYALRSSYAAPPHPVRIDADGSVIELPCVELPPLPGTLTDLDTTAPDGTRVRSWLVLPSGDEPAPLLLWIHGGPLGSWNAWSWRWNPWLLAARGYAVLLPDPGLSTGYGNDFIQRGWGAWGRAPFDDLMAATDAACAHPRVDATRTAAMGGSFGGYMANWVAGHTDRFDAIVTHASLWALDQFGVTTDASYYWMREMTPEMATANSPHNHVGRIATPMLVIHGDKDYRVPIGEALRLWYQLLTESRLPAADDGTSPHQFLYFPSENHWVLSPQHAILWYQVVTAFLSHHVLGEDIELPETLG